MISRIIFIVLIGAITSQVLAVNWALIGKNETVEVFIDLDSIKDEGVAKKVNSYKNLLQPSNPNYKSLENEYSIFCQENAYIEYNPIIYADYNRVGPVARGTFSQDKKNIDSKNSIPGVIAQYACNKPSNPQASQKQSQNSDLLSESNKQNSPEINKLKKLWIGHWSSTPEGCVEGSGLHIEAGSDGNLNGRFMVKNNFGRILQNSKSIYKNFRYENNSILIFDKETTFFNGEGKSTTDERINITKGEFSYISPGAIKYMNCSDPNIKVQGTQNIQNAITQDRKIFGLVDDLQTNLIDQSSASRRLSSCIGVMKGAQFAAYSISQQNLAIALAQQESAFNSFGSSRFPPVETLERMTLDGAMRDAQAGAERLARTNQQALVFKIANNCKITLAKALKN